MRSSNPSLPDTLTLVTVNLGNQAHDIRGREQSNALRRTVTLTRPGVVVIQEAQPDLVAPRGYRLIREPGPGAGHNGPILVRDGLPMRGNGALFVHDGRFGQWPAKWLTWVTVGNLAVGNWHVNAHIDLGGRPRDPHTDRTRLGLKHIADGARWARFQREHGHAVALGGDTNVASEHDHAKQYPGFPAKQLGLAGLREHRAARQGATLARRNVDRWFTCPRLGVTGGHMFDLGPRFDHNGRALTVTGWKG